MLQSIIRLGISLLMMMSISMHANAADKLILDDEHSYVLWKIKHLGFSTQSGKWYVKGFVVLDKENPKNSKVEVQIDISKLVTGIPELDKHLKSKLFFDVEHFPTATFVSDKVDVLNDNQAKVHGMLTLHGISKPVVLDVSINKVGKNPINDRMTVGFTATAEIKRSDFGINTLLPDLGNEVGIEIGAEAYQPKS